MEALAADHSPVEQGLPGPLRRSARLTAVVLSHNSLPTLKEVVDAVAGQRSRPDRLIVVDNASSDGSVDYLERLQQSGDADVLFLDENVGVGSGHNAGWRAAMQVPGCEFIWALEHDSTPTPSCLELLLETATSHPEKARIGTVVPRQDLPGAPAVREPRPVRRGRRMTFNASLLSVQAIREAGLLREDFFVGQEDREYALRLIDAGFLVLHDLRAVVRHRNLGRRRRGIKPGVARTYYGTRNRIYLEVHLRRRPLAAIEFPVRSAVAIGRTLVREDHKLDRVRARFRATLDGLAGRMGRKEYYFLGG